MKPIRPQMAFLACVGLGIGLMLSAQSPPQASAPAATPAATVVASYAPAAERSFAQPVRETPVGTKAPTRRSFLGAPPPNPHAFVGERNGRQCLECHALEHRIEKRHQPIAPVPHPEFSQCQSCHVSGTDTSDQVFRENSFVGLDDPGKGTRAHPLAPPTIPHKTFMRDNCLSCHGPTGKQRIKTPHPARSQCQQCHVSDATKNYDRPVPWSDLRGEL